MNKKLILPLVIGAGIIGLYFLMKNKQPPLVSVAPSPAQPTPKNTQNERIAFQEV